MRADRLAEKMARLAARPGRCEHAFLPGICPVADCQNWDGVEETVTLEQAEESDEVRLCRLCRQPLSALRARHGRLYCSSACRNKSYG